MQTYEDLSALGTQLKEYHFTKHPVWQYMRIQPSGTRFKTGFQSGVSIKTAGITGSCFPRVSEVITAVECFEPPYKCTYAV